MKPSDPPKGRTVMESVGLIQHANVSSCAVVAAACVSGRTKSPLGQIIGERTTQKSRDATGAALRERLQKSTTWADVRIMLIGFHKACLEELEAANK
jgi:hypothetical protein